MYGVTITFRNRHRAPDFFWRSRDPLVGREDDGNKLTTKTQTIEAEDQPQRFQGQKMTPIRQEKMYTSRSQEFGGRKLYFFGNDYAQSSKSEKKLKCRCWNKPGMPKSIEKRKPAPSCSRLLNDEIVSKDIESQPLSQRRRLRQVTYHEQVGFKGPSFNGLSSVRSPKLPYCMRRAEIHWLIPVNSGADVFTDRSKDARFPAVPTSLMTRSRKVNKIEGDTLDLSSSLFRIPSAKNNPSIKVGRVESDAPAKMLFLRSGRPISAVAAADETNLEATRASTVLPDHVGRLRSPAVKYRRAAIHTPSFSRLGVVEKISDEEPTTKAMGPARNLRLAVEPALDHGDFAMTELAQGDYDMTPAALKIIQNIKCLNDFRGKK